MDKKTYEEYLIMVRRDGMFLQNIPEEMQTDEIIDSAIGNDPWAFQWIEDDRKKTFERCVKAVMGDYDLLDYVPEELKWIVGIECGLISLSCV